VYSCGHKPKKIFIKKNDIVFLFLYNQWKEVGTELCFDCWNNKRRKRFLQKSKKLLEG